MFICSNCGEPRILKHPKIADPNGICRSCSNKRNVTHRRDYSGSGNPMYGKKHPHQLRWKMKRWNSHEFSDETRVLLRIMAIKQHHENGVDFPAIDAGASEYFDNMNSYNGFHIQHPNVEIKALGYFVDGYDPNLHAVFEYDGKGHLRAGAKEKDHKRQEEIVHYYKSIGRPLSFFYRVNATGVGLKGMTDVLVRQ